MNKKITYPIAIIASVLALIFIVQNFNQQDKPITHIDPALIPVKQALLELQQDEGFQMLGKQEQLEKTYAILEKIPDSHQQLKHQYQVAMGSLPDITFYGRIIDQHGLPVKNASVWYSGENAYISAGGGMGAGRTDDDGYFMIDTSGAALVLGAVSHPEIDEVFYELRIDTNSATKKQYKSVIRFLSHDKKGAALNYNNYSEKDKAYIVHAWRLGEYEGAIEGNVISDYDNDGKYYTLTFDQTRLGVRKKEGKTDGHIYISCRRPHMTHNRDYGDWSISITPVNGGIQETDDIYMNIAPESGYQTSLDINMTKSSQGYVHELRDKKYYFKSNSGKEYGSLLMEIKPFSRASKEACRIEVFYKLNPTGSRNLELKRDNTSQPQLPSQKQLASNWTSFKPVDTCIV